MVYLPDRIPVCTGSGMYRLHCTYCLEVWVGTNERNLNSIFILQKRIIRILKSLPFRTHTSPYFERLNILNIFQLCKYKVILFMFKYVKG